MPHAVLRTGAQTGAVTSPGRSFIPGVTPGGQFAGKSKPAFFLRDVNVEVLGMAPNLGAGGEEDLVLFLTMSQEVAMAPHFLLPVAQAAIETQTAVGSVRVALEKTFHAQGTMWAPRFVGWRTLVGGSWTNYDFVIHIDYEVVFLPWRDWFVHWEFLDGTPTAQREY